MTRGFDAPEATRSIRVVLARTIAELDDAARIRGEVYAEVMGLDRTAPSALREVNAFDLLDTTSVFLAYRDEIAVGTIRLVMPNAELRRRQAISLGGCSSADQREPARSLDRGKRDLVDEPTTCRLGLPIECGAEILERPVGGSIAELGRAAVIPALRGSTVIGRLYDAAYRASRAADVTHWIGFGLTGTDDPGDAELVSRILAHRGRTVPAPRYRPSDAGPKAAGATADPARPLYTAEQRARASTGDIADLPLPGAIAFHLGTGAGVIGEPLFDATFREFMIPVFLPLDDFMTTTFGRRYCGRAG